MAKPWERYGKDGTPKLSAGKPWERYHSNGAQKNKQEPEDPRDWDVFLKNAGPEILDSLKHVAGGVKDSVLHPVDTYNAPGSVASQEGIYRAARSVPIAGELLHGAVGKANKLAMGPAAESAYNKRIAESDIKHYKEHPVADFVQRSLGMFAVPGGLPAQAGTLAVDAFQRSRGNGASITDALRDARNAASLVVGAGVLGKVGGYAAGKAAKPVKAVIQREAQVTNPAIARYRENPKAVRDAGKAYLEDPEILENQLNKATAPHRQYKIEATKKLRQEQENLAEARDNARFLDPKAEQYRREAEAQHQNSINAGNRLSSVDPVAERYRIEAHNQLPHVQDARDAVQRSAHPAVPLGAAIVEHLKTKGKEKTSQLSGESFKILSEEGAVSSIAKMKQYVQKRKNELKIGGKVVPIQGPAAGAYNALTNFEATLDNVKRAFGNKIPSTIEKELIQTLDSLTKEAYTTNAGALTPPAAKMLAGVRSDANQNLRTTSPKFADKMDELSPKVRAIDEMSKIFGSEEKARSALATAANPDSPAGYSIRQKIAQYDQLNGTTFLKDLETYYDKPKQDLVRQQALHRMLSEKHETAAKKHKTDRANDDVREKALHRLLKGKYEEAKAKHNLQHKQNVEQATYSVKDASNQLEEATLQADQFKRLKPEVAEKVLAGISRGKNKFSAEQLKLLDPSLHQNVLDTGYARQFSKSTTNGARKALAGFATGLATGSTTLAGVFAVVGFLADQYGGLAVRTALDAGIALDKIAKTKYIGPVMKAAAESPKALRVVHYTLMKNDPEYRKLQESQQ